MPRKQVVECTCDRCNKVWYEAAHEGAQPAAFSLTWLIDDPVEVSWELLCQACSKAVRNYVASILRETRAKEAETEVEAPPEETPLPRDLKRVR